MDELSTHLRAIFHGPGARGRPYPTLHLPKHFLLRAGVLHQVDFLILRSSLVKIPHRDPPDRSVFLQIRSKCSDDPYRTIIRHVRAKLFSSYGEHPANMRFRLWLRDSNDRSNTGIDSAEASHSSRSLLAVDLADRRCSGSSECEVTEVRRSSFLSLCTLTSRGA